MPIPVRCDKVHRTDLPVAAGWYRKPEAHQLLAQVESPRFNGLPYQG